MKKLRGSVAMTLAMALVLSFTACEEENVVPNSNGSDSNTSSTSGVSNSSSSDGGASSTDTSEKEITSLEDKKLVWLSWYDIDRNGAAYKLFKEKYDADIEFVKVGNYGTRYDNLSAMVLSDESPDLFPFEINNFPSGSNMYSPIDDYFNFNNPRWDKTRDIIKKFAWNGKTYCAVTELDTSQLLWYRKDTFLQAGLEDPKKLYDKGEWTWANFIKLGEDFKKKNVDENALIDGFHVDQDAITSTGMPMVDLVDGKLVFNADETKMADAVGLLDTLHKKGLRYALENNDWAVNYKNFVTGKTLFFIDGSWRYTETWVKAKLTDVGFVPFPKYDKADNYYVQMRQNAYMFPKGAKNSDGFTAWINCVLLTTNDEEYKAAGRKQAIEEFKWTEELLDFLDDLKNQKGIKPVFDFKNGIGQDLAATTSAETPIEALTKRIYIQNDVTWETVKAEQRPVIEARIKLLNEKGSLES